MATYEELRQRHFNEMVQRLPAFIARASWSPEQLKAERERLLRDLIRFVKQESPWHGRRLARVDPDRLREEDLADLPVMTKADLMANYDDILTDRRLSLDLIERHLDALTDDAYLLDQYHAAASGGSSGQRGVYVYGWDGWLPGFMMLPRAMSRWNAGHPAPRPMKVAAVAAENARHISAALRRTFSPPGFQDYHKVPITQPLPSVVEELNRIQPYMIAGYPSAMRLLVVEARAGRLAIAPKRVAVAGEPLLPEIRQDIEDTWQAAIFNNYSCSEAGWIACGCGEGDSLHVQEDMLIIEPVDASGNPVRVGDRSAKIYATPLFPDTVLPLIRCEITDEVTMLAEPCTCGNTLRRLAAPQGRLDDGFTYRQGLWVHPIAFRSPLGLDPNVVEYQVRQTDRGADISLVTKGPVDVGNLQDKIVRSLERVGLRRAEISLTIVEHLERSATGKLKRFFPLTTRKSPE